MESIRHSSLSARAEPGAVVEGRATVPRAVPRLPLDRLAYGGRVRVPASRRGRRRGPSPAARTARWCATAASRATRFRRGRRAPTRFMPSFQSPVPISGRPCSPVSSMHWSRPRAQCSNSEAESSATIGWKKRVVLAGPQRRAFEKRHDLVQNRGIVRPGDIGRGRDRRARRGRPKSACARPARSAAATNAGHRPRRTAGTRRAADGARVASGLAKRQRHAVLQLVAKAVGAARLIERRARPDAAGERLVEQPAVQHDVHGPVGRLHLDCPEQRLPVVRHLGQDGVEIGRAIAADQRPGFVGRSRTARGSRRLRSSRPAPRSTTTCRAAQGSRPAPVAPRQRR